MKTHTLPTFLLVLALALSACNPSTPTSVIVPSYINMDGSPILVQLGLAWAEHFMHENRGSVISVVGNGEEGAFAAFANGTINLVASTRLMTDAEMDAALARDIHPVETLVAREAIAVVVNPQNPLSRLTVQQVADIFSGKVNNWSEVGGDEAPIMRIAPAPEASPSAFFINSVLHDSAIVSDIKIISAHEELIAAVSADPNAIGYEDLGFVTLDVKLLALAKSESGPFVLPTFDSVSDHTYPLTRDLYLYASASPIDMIQRYIFWIMHGEGQHTAQQHGFVPILALRPTRTPAP